MTGGRTGGSDRALLLDGEPMGDAATMDPARFAAEVRRWLAEHADELAPFRATPPGPLEAAMAHERPFHRMLYDAGFARWGWPVEHGGLGGTPLLRAVLHEEVAAAGYVMPEGFVGLEIVGPTLVHFAPALASAHLPAKLRGDEEWCQGLSEPDAGSDLASLRTRAVDEGDHFVVQGQKIWTSYAQLSTWCGLLARTGTTESRHRGLTMFWVDLRSPGVTVRPIPCATGRNELAEVFFDDVVVPKAHVIGEVGGGWDAVMYQLQFERGNFAWLRQAWLHSRLHDALASAPEGGTRPSAAAALGEAWTTLAALRERALSTVTRLARGESPGPEISVDKILLATAEQAVFDAVRLLRTPSFELGGDDEARWRQPWSFSRIVSIYGGTGEVQRDLVAERLLGLPRGR